MPTSGEEEIESDSEEVGGAKPDDSGTRKRKRMETSSAERDYGVEVAEGHKKLRSHCEAVLCKWNEKTKLASGKITSKVGVVVTLTCHMKCLPAGIHGSGAINSVPN